MPLETLPWDITDSLVTPERIALYLEAVLEDGDPAPVAAAIGDVARARGMAQIAQQTGLSRETLYRTLSDRRLCSLQTCPKRSTTLAGASHVRPQPAPVPRRGSRLQVA
ncbi:addiction module antidote protein [Methylobacterium nodulans]|uniref:addiction module antidote protein n=1 Tax=Methylobacterium nodulans TaxID=114616 RepID=UPI0009FED169|nr:addiction module antidote protein [Methylobacterium nodulans]